MLSFVLVVNFYLIVDCSFRLVFIYVVYCGYLFRGACLFNCFDCGCLLCVVDRIVVLFVLVC